MWSCHSRQGQLLCLLRKEAGEIAASRRKYSNNGTASETEDLGSDPAWAQANADPRGEPPYGASSWDQYLDVVEGRS